VNRFKSISFTKSIGHFFLPVICVSFYHCSYLKAVCSLLLDDVFFDPGEFS
jgi:hypothetical protein